MGNSQAAHKYFATYLEFASELIFQMHLLYKKFPKYAITTDQSVEGYSL